MPSHSKDALMNCQFWCEANLQERIGLSDRLLNETTETVEKAPELQIRDILNEVARDHQLLLTLTNELAAATERADQTLGHLRERAKTVLNQRNPSISLPTEIIVEFLSWGLLRKVDKIKPYYAHIRAITSVCKRWREVGLQDPRFFAFIGYEAASSPSKSFPPILEVARRVKGLSGPPESHLVVSINLDADHTMLKVGEELHTLLISQFLRITELTISTSQSYHLVRFFENRFPNLELLSISLDNNEYGLGVSPATRISIVPPPQLRTFKLAVAFPRDLVDIDSDDVSSIEALSVLGRHALTVDISHQKGFIGSDEVYRMLLNVPIVEHLTLGITWQSAHIPFVITLPNLKTFNLTSLTRGTIWSETSSSPPELLTYFIVPRLQALTLGPGSYEQIKALRADSCLSDLYPDLRSIKASTDRETSTYIALKLGGGNDSVERLELVMDMDTMTQFFIRLLYPPSEPNDDSDSGGGDANLVDNDHPNTAEENNEGEEGPKEPWLGLTSLTIHLGDADDPNTRVYPPIELVRRTMEAREELRLHVCDCSSQERSKAFQKWSKALKSSFKYRFTRT